MIRKWIDLKEHCRFVDSLINSKCVILVKTVDLHITFRSCTLNTNLKVGFNISLTKYR